MALAITGCASTMSRVTTWEGNPDEAAQAATLKAPGAIRVLKVNGRSMTNFLMDDIALDYALLPGQNQVVFTYKTIWAKKGVVENGESKVDVVESKPQVVRFEAEPDSVYRFAFQKPTSRTEAQAQMENFSAAIVSDSGQEVARSQVWTQKKEPVARTSMPSATEDAASAGSGSALERLKAIWPTATEEEKRAFLRWAFE
jgi:uncharacterized protein YccT (UPF0319 family)